MHESFSTQSHYIEIHHVLIRCFICVRLQCLALFDNFKAYNKCLTLMYLNHADKKGNYNIRFILDLVVFFACLNIAKTTFIKRVTSPFCDVIKDTRLISIPVYGSGFRFGAAPN